ncbi:MAG: MFS transporter [Bacilli bacterium]|jgi:DHA1 family multidrug resistance protein-like MFS transporter|nr:MFS transporter [Bacilli bacterium]
MNSNTKHLYGFLGLHLFVFTVFNMGHPVTPQFIININAPIFMTGLLFATMSLAQFIFAPLWGQIADRFGNKVLFIGPLGYCIGQLGFVFFSAPILLIIFRFIAGVFAAVTNTVHFAYISEKTNASNRSKFLGFGTLFIPIGVFLGYSIGGYIGTAIDPRFSFLMQAILAIVAGICLFKYVDSAKKEEESHLKDINFNIIKEDVKILKRNNDTCLKFILLVTFLNIVSYQLAISQVAVILANQFHYETTFVGLFVAFFNLFGGITSFIIQRLIFNGKRELHAYLPYLSLLSVGCLMIACLVIYINPAMMWIGLTLATLLNTVFLATVQDLLVKVDIHHELGALVGLNQAVQGLGMVVGAFLGGMFVSYYIFFPLIASACVFFITFVINRFVVKKQIDDSLHKYYYNKV